jgi:hypothetical protein
MAFHRPPFSQAFFYGEEEGTTRFVEDPAPRRRAANPADRRNSTMTHSAHV